MRHVVLHHWPTGSRAPVRDGSIPEALARGRPSIGKVGELPCWVLEAIPVMNELTNLQKQRGLVSAT
jgi:hypothetical protein